jgi:hypothetical protein
MEIGCRLRITLAAAIAIAGAGSVVVASSVEAGPAQLLPDLVTMRPVDSPWLDLNVHKKGGQKVAALRLSNRIGNHGTGPLELFAGPVDAACEGQYPGDDREADQRIFEDTNGNGTFERGTDGEAIVEKVGCFEFHPDPSHLHWHFQDFSQYKLIDADTGEPVAGPSKKIGFCIVDNSPAAFPDLPGAPPNGVYPVTGDGGCGFGNPDDGPGRMGLSVGYADTYTMALPGQRLDVTGVTTGRYCLVSTANPAHEPPESDPSQLLEATDENNARRTPIKINLEKKRVKEVAGGCVSAPKS